MGYPICMANYHLVKHYSQLRIGGFVVTMIRAKAITNHISKVFKILVIYPQGRSIATGISKSFSI